MPSASSLGGKAKAKKINDLYFANPNRCAFCQLPILRKGNENLSQIKAKRFCSKTCAAKFNNNIRKKHSICKICGTEIPNGRRRCSPCLKVYVSKIGNMLKRDSTHAKIRGHARTMYKSVFPIVKCDNCSYLNFTEICHKVPVSSFSGDTKISVINDIDNLIQLCPNCHWEFDHNKLDIK